MSLKSRIPKLTVRFSTREKCTLCRRKAKYMYVLLTRVVYRCEKHKDYVLSPIYAKYEWDEYAKAWVSIER